VQGGFDCVREDPKPRRVHLGPKKDAFAPKPGMYQANNLPAFASTSNHVAAPTLYSMPPAPTLPYTLFPSRSTTAQDLTDLMSPAQPAEPNGTNGFDFFLSPEFSNILVDPIPKPLPELAPPLFSPSSRSETETLLVNFFYDFVLPSWASIYPPNIARNMIERSREISEKHSLNLLARQAAAACYIAAYRERGGKGKYHYNAFHKQALVGKLAHIPVDPQGFFFKALTELEAAQYDQSMTVEGCLWAAGDLHIAAMAYFDAKVVLRVKQCADRIISATFGPNPLIDLATLQGVPSASELR
jgi:hypothetical protein